MIPKDFRRVAAGKTSIIYEKEGIAYKQFYPEYPADWIAHEVAVQNIVCEHTTLPVLPLSLADMPKTISMRYLKGVELADRMRKDHYKEGIDDLIRLQIEVHQCVDLPLPQAHDVLLNQIQNAPLEAELKVLAIRSLERIARTTNLCHFDFHPSNLFFDGIQYYLLDWATAKVGNPVLDIARTYLLLHQYAFRFSGKYLKQIVKRLSLKPDDVYAAIPIMAALRTFEPDAAPFRETLVRLIKEYS
ncbi:MAG: aminoglycoside phosphotransferase family protein [Bacillus subtilis]|nr:aminoglycoside phosphotransferase family protein [Bacillus subtilis]